MKPRILRHRPEVGPAVSDWIVAGPWAPPAFLQVMPMAKPPAVRRVGTIRTLCPRKNMGIVLDASSGDNALFTLDEIAPAYQPPLREGDQVTYVAVAGADGLWARQLRHDTSDIPPPPSDMLMARGWR